MNPDLDMLWPSISHSKPNSVQSQVESIETNAATSINPLKPHSEPYVVKINNTNVALPINHIFCFCRFFQLQWILTRSKLSPWINHSDAKLSATVSQYRQNQCCPPYQLCVESTLSARPNWRHQNLCCALNHPHWNGPDAIPMWWHNRMPLLPAQSATQKP